jgi:hypothetical protein
LSADLNRHKQKILLPIRISKSQFQGAWVNFASRSSNRGIRTGTFDGSSPPAIRRDALIGNLRSRSTRALWP